MKKYFIFLLLGMFFTQAVTAQKVKKAEKDTVKASSSKDRLRNAGPKDGWSDANKTDTAKKVKTAPAAPARRKGS